MFVLAAFVTSVTTLTFYKEGSNKAIQSSCLSSRDTRKLEQLNLVKAVVYNQIKLLIKACQFGAGRLQPVKCYINTIHFIMIWKA